MSNEEIQICHDSDGAWVLKAIREKVDGKVIFGTYLVRFANNGSEVARTDCRWYQFGNGEMWQAPGHEITGQSSKADPLT